MKKKKICVTVIFVCILISFTVYFMPVKLSECLDDGSQINIQVDTFDIKDGEPIIDQETYSDITEEQKNSILKLCSQYSYRRRMDTLFSDGSISEVGDTVVYIFVNGENGSDKQIVISSTDKVAIGNRTFKMKHAEQFINELIEILEK